MTAPQPPAGPPEPPEPQPVLNPLTRAAIFLVVAVNDGGEPAARDYLALFDLDVEKIASALEKRK